MTDLLLLFLIILGLDLLPAFGPPTWSVLVIYALNSDLPRDVLERSRNKAIMGLALFALSPLPSAQLFEAAGLLRVRLLPFTVAFFAGRLVSYFIYVSTAAKIRGASIGEAFRGSFTQPVGMALQIAMIATLVVLTRLNWSRLIKAI